MVEENKILSQTPTQKQVIEVHGNSILGNAFSKPKHRRSLSSTGRQEYFLVPAPSACIILIKSLSPPIKSGYILQKAFAYKPWSRFLLPHALLLLCRYTSFAVQAPSATGEYLIAIHVFIYDFALGCRIEGKIFTCCSASWRRLLCHTLQRSEPW